MERTVKELSHGRLAAHSNIGRVGFLLTTAAPLLIGAQSLQGNLEERLLAAHNRERATAGVSALHWDARLAASASHWAARVAVHGQLVHEPGAAGSGHGENLWIGTVGHFGPEAMVHQWTEEKANFVPGSFPFVSRTGRWEDVGHYPQMIWRDTRRVGCAIRSGPAWDVLVCRYSLPGNVAGEAPI